MKIWKLMKSSLILCSIYMLSGCYLTSQGVGLLGYYGKAKPIDQVLKQDLSPETRAFLHEVLDIRRFAIETLGLKENKNYSVYAEIDRDFLAYVVSATAQDSFDHYYWGFPFVGDMPYKGFFKLEDAQKEAEKMKAGDYDVWIRKVDAFSTLGILTDPLFSYMQDYSPYRLANLLIHEQTHATIWVKNQTSFNEQLATFVGDLGARLYILERFGEESQEFLSIDQDEQDRDTFRQKIFTLKDSLTELYSDPPENLSDLLKQKEQIYEQFKAVWASEYDRDFITDNYRNLDQIHMNNAFLNLYSLYMADFTPYQQVYENVNENLVSFIQVLSTINRKEKNPELWLTEQSQ